MSKDINPEWSAYVKLDNIEFEIDDFCETLDGGQAFTWYKSENFTIDCPEYVGTFSKNFAKLRLKNKSVEVSVPHCLDLDGVVRNAHDYLDGQRDYKKLRKVLKKIGDDKLDKAMQVYPTLRILRQNPSEAIISFICSSSKRIVQIKQCVKLLAENLGEEILPNVYALPNFNKIANTPLETIKNCKLGFRADYLKKSAQKIAEDKFDANKLSQMPYCDAKKYLLSLRGIGEKVADCILLFGAAKFQAFPVDTWIRQAMTELYNTPNSPDAIRNFAEEKFGENAGFAQQLIFANIRKK